MAQAINFTNSQSHIFPELQCWKHGHSKKKSFLGFSLRKIFPAFPPSQKLPCHISALCVREHRIRLTLRRWRVLVWYTVAAPIHTAHPSMIHSGLAIHTTMIHMYTGLLHSSSSDTHRSLCCCFNDTVYPIGTIYIQCKYDTYIQVQ